MFDLSGKSAIVTGGGSGIGAAIARRFAAAGARVLVADVADASADAQSWGCAYRRTDVSEPTEVADLCAEAVSRFGALDIMINNAGVASGASISAAEAAGFERLWRVNALGVLMGVKEAAARMGAGGAIVNISSITAARGVAGQGQYAATKAAIISLTQTAALEFGPMGIRVNCVAPGVIETPMAMSQAPDMSRRTAAVFSFLGRTGRADEVAAAVHFLASDDASYITGQTLLVDGGWSAGSSLKAMELAFATNA